MRIKLLLVINLLLIIPFSGFSQRGDFQELKSDILNAKTDQEKMERIIILGMNYGRQFPDSLHYYADSLMSNRFEAPQLANAGQTFLSGVQDYNNGNLEGAIGKFEISSAQFEAQNNTNLFFRSMNLLGISYLRTGNADESIKIFERIIEQGTPMAEDNRSALLAAHGNLSNAHRRFGNYAKAIFHIEESMQYADSTRQKMSTNFSYLNMGQMLIELELYDKAINAFKMIDEREMEGTSMLAAFYNNMALIKDKVNQRDSAAYYYKKTMGMPSTPRVKGQFLRPAIYLSFYYSDKGKFEKALYYLEKAREQCNAYCPTPSRLEIEQAAIRMHRLQEDFESAVRYANKLENIISTEGISYTSTNSFQEISNLYEQMGQMDKALEYQRIHNELNSRSDRQTRAMRVSEQQAMLQQLQAERALNEAQIASTFYQRLSLNQWVGGLILLTAVISLYVYYKKEKANRTLKEDELDKLRNEVQEIQASPEREEYSEASFIALKSKAILKLNSILYIKSDGPYVEVFTEGKERPEIDRNTLKALLAELPDKIFIQVHRSYIVNINYIQSIYSSKLVLKNGWEINISRTFKSKVEEALKQ